MTHTDNDTDFAAREVMMEAFSPIDEIDADDCIDPAKAEATLGYFAERGWEGYRLGMDSIDLVRIDETEIRLMITSISGVIDTEARFTLSDFGVQMFAAAVRAL